MTGQHRSGARWPDCGTGWHDQCTQPAHCGCHCHVKGPEPAPDVLQQLREALAALTTTVVCHPDQVEALEAAAADLEGCGPVRIVGNAAVSPGRAIVMGPGLQQLDVPR